MIRHTNTLTVGIIFDAVLRPKLRKGVASSLWATVDFRQIRIIRPPPPTSINIRTRSRERQ